jgi:regulator of protease activity HflC (stomatin/prohibitin superfamily)
MLTSPAGRVEFADVRRWSLVALLLVLGPGCSYMTVNAGEVGLLWTPNGVEDKVYKEGEHSIGYYDRATIYNTRSQERDEQLEVLASNGLRVTIDASIRYHIIPEEVVKLDRELGVHYYSTLVGPTLRSQARRVVGRFQPEEIYSTQRELIEREIREGIEKVIQGRHIELEAVLVRNVTLPVVIQQAINNKLEAEQSSLKMKFIIEKTRQEADQHLIESKALSERQSFESKAQIERQTFEAQALNEREKARITAEAEQTLIQAKAAAEAKRIDGKATADYQLTVQAHLTEAVLKLEKIKALTELAQSSNAKLLLIGEGRENTLMDLK